MGSKENGSPGKREDVLRCCQATTPAKGLYENPCLFPLLQVHFPVHISSLWQSVINSTPPLMSVFDSPPHLNSCCLSSQEGEVSAATVANGIVPSSFPLYPFGDGGEEGKRTREKCQ